MGYNNKMKGDNKMKYEKLSVIMSAFKRAHTIQPALYSLISQEVPPDEIVIIDDGSDDDFADKVSDMSSAYPEANIKYHFNRNPGWTICIHDMNYAVQKASHELIMTTMPELLHLDNDIKIIKEFFSGGKNKKVFCKGGDLYELRGYQLLNSLSDEQLFNPKQIIELPCVSDWYNGFETQENTITHHKAMLHHISGFWREDLIAIGGYDENFLSNDAGLHAASGYDDVDLFCRFAHYGKEVVIPEMRGIHLHHDAPPPASKDPAIVNINYNIMQDRLTKMQNNPDGNFWKVNIGKKWGVLKK